MELNYILVVLGLVICFGGIQLKKFSSALMGISWGGIIGFIIAVISAKSIYNLDKGDTLYVIIIFSLIFGVLSIALDSLTAVINSFLMTLVVMIITLLSMATSFEDLEIIVFLSMVIATIIAFIVYHIKCYAIIITTAFSGAFIANIGFAGINHNYEFDELIYQLTLKKLILQTLYSGYSYNHTENSNLWIEIIIGTIFLGIIGIIIQKKRFIPYKTNNDSDNSLQLSNPIFNETENAAFSSYDQKVDKVINNLSMATKMHFNAVSKFIGTRIKIDKRTTISENKIFFIIPIAYFLCIFINSLFRQGFLSIISTAIYYTLFSAFLSVAVYLTLYKQKKIVIIYFLVYIVIAGSYYLSNIHVSYRMTIAILTPYILTPIVLIILERLIKNDRLKIIIMPFMETVIMNHLTLFSFKLYFSFRDLIIFFMILVIEYFLILKLQNVNILKSNQKIIFDSAQINESISCPNCGNFNSITSIFCGKCGSKLK